MKNLLLPIMVFTGLFFNTLENNVDETLPCSADSTYVESFCVSGCFQAVPQLTGNLASDANILQENPPRPLTFAEQQMVQEALDEYCLTNYIG